MTKEPPIAALLETLRAFPRFLITSHARPDGDAIGSVIAMACILDQLAIESVLVFADPIPQIYRTLPGIERVRISTDVRLIEPDPGVPVIVLECDSIARTGLKGLEGRRLINIDHHASGKNFGDLNWIDEHACAVGAMVYRIAIAGGLEIPSEMAVCLYTAIVSDTGSFTYPGTNLETFAMAHDLVRRGADAGRIARDIYFSNPESKIRLLGAALSNFRKKGAIAWSWITLSEMERADAGAEDCEGVVNYLIGIAGVESAVFLRELPGDQFRLSIRSKGEIDVARAAEKLGGGGHRSASGCTIDGPLEEAIRRILTALQEQRSQELPAPFEQSLQKQGKA